ncbi:MAG: TetR/AcrR family transcriptional regulator [Bacteroidetes bacterium]|nr:TetR/AcrR family transcriptional regulator [Bacteroidota bacterium]
MRDLAHEMNIEAASLYSHISSKEEMLQMICFSMAEKFLSAIHETNDIYFNAEEKLRLAIKNHIEIVCENTNASKVFNDEWRHLIEPHKAEFIEKRNEYESGFLEIIKTGNEEHLFKEVDSKFAVLTILSTLNWINQWYKPNGKMTPQEIAQELSNFILTGLKK